MKTNLFLRGLKATAVFFLVVVLAASCRENNPELEFTPEEKETQMSSVSDVLYQFTLQYDDENAAGLDDAIEKVRKNEFVKEVVKESDHIKVTYKNGLEIYYPFIMPSAFEGGADDALEAMVDSPLLTRADPYGGYYRGKCKIFNYFSDDPKRAGQTRILEKVARRARFSLRLVSESGPSEDETDMIYGKDKVTIENIEAAIRDSENEVVIIATHGFQNQVVTSEYIQAKSLAGLSQKDLRDFMAQERLVACGEKDAYGNPVYNKAWYVQNYSGRWNADFVYFTGCSIFSPSVCKALNNNPFAYSLIAGWDGKNNIGEALLMALFDSFINGMSFKEFYAKEGSHTDRSYDSNLVFAGKKTDYKPGDETYTVTERTSRLKYPRNFCEKSYVRTNTVQMILEDKLSKEGYFYCDVHDVLNGEKKKRSEFHYQALFDLFDQLLTASDCSVTYWLGQPGVYRVSLHYVFTKNGVEQNILIDEKYILQCNGFGVNGAEETIPTIKVASVVTESADFLYGCQTTVCPEDLTQQGFKVWERDNPSQMMEIQGTPHENNIQVFQTPLNGLKAGTTYQAQAYVKYITGDEFAGNVVEFTVSNGYNPDSSVSVPEAIDLGLPSGLKWASFNLGATKPEEYGNYYAWGETTPKESYGWAVYQFGTENSLTKYCDRSDYGYEGFIDGKTTLDPDDDAAIVNLGGKWRMPTFSELAELKDNCTWEWITLNGVNGSKVTGPNGNSIFIPAAGFSFTGDVGFYAYLWSSSLFERFPSWAHGLSIGDFSYLTGTWGDVRLDLSFEHRERGQSIRPVYDESEDNGMVDLGLSVKWASCNLGATRPELFGSYFAWGETEPKEDYSWDTYLWSYGSENTMTKYCTDSRFGYNGFVDGKTTLDPENDAAHVLLGGKWRMPTKEEQDELRQKCSGEWTSLHGVNGWRFTAPNGNSIFLPASGWGDSGSYWSSSLYGDYQNYAYTLIFKSSSYQEYVDWSQDFRYSGNSIRPVYAE